MSLNSEEAGGAAIVAVPAVCLLGMCVARGGDFTGLGDALPVLGIGAAVVVGIGAVWSLASGALGGSSERTFRLHHEGGERGIAARHEAGHIVMAQEVGCTVTAAAINADGSGWTDYRMPPAINPCELGAIDVAGEVASGTTSGGGSDQHYFPGMLGGIRGRDRGYVRRKSYAIARRHVAPGVFGTPGRVARYERRLLRRGRL